MKTPWIEQRGQAPAELNRARLEQEIGKSPWLVVVPHDDDLVLGSGVLLALAARMNVEIHVAVSTNGALGYAALEDREHLVDTRRGEMERAVEVLALDSGHLHWLGFRDGSLVHHLGVRGADEPAALGHTLTKLMRMVRPGAVLCCHDRDVHPDHRAVGWDTSIACFWANADIWRELGEPIALPNLIHYGVYAAFEGPPDFRVVGDRQAQDKKLRALGCFASQPVIDANVAQAREDGPVEFFQYAARVPHRAASYAAWFAPPDVG